MAMMWFCDDMMKTPNGIIPGSTPGESLTRHLRIHIMGIVQGVGFRPFVYTLAKELGLSGNVANSGNGVIIHLSGSSTIIDTFLDTLKTSPPPLAHISEISRSEERREGKEWLRLCRSRGSAYHEKKKRKKRKAT